MTYQTPTPDADGVDPADDPSGYLTDLLARYFRPGLVDSLARTWVPVLLGAVLTWINARWDITIPHGASSTLVIVTTGATIAGYYAGARLIERRFPRLGRWLIALRLTKARPTYAKPAAAAQVEAAAARTPGRQ